jgi:iron complex transport system ATP-binding protein
MEVKKLSFSYGKHQVLKDVSLKIERKKITTILGPNGCGKSTLFYLMTKNLPLNSGEILLDGKNIQEIKLKDFARKVSIVNQGNTIQGDITVESLVSYGRTPFLSMMQKMGEEDEKYIEWAMDITDVKKFKDQMVSSLSGGQKQRVWIAMALAQNTDILFLDEPTTYLDVRYQIQILELIKRLNQEYHITIVMVLHDINQAIHYSDYIVGFKDGVMVGAGDAEKIVTKDFIKDIYDIDLDIITVNNKKLVINV